MLFIFGISSKEEKLDHLQTLICDNCGSYGRLEVYSRYTYLSLFFIPTFRWNKKYYVRKTCCQSLYTIEKELGKAIVRGENISLDEGDLNPLNVNNNYQRRCPNCYFNIEDREFEYCPKCGKSL